MIKKSSRITTASDTDPLSSQVLRDHKIKRNGKEGKKSIWKGRYSRRIVEAVEGDDEDSDGSEREIVDDDEGEELGEENGDSGRLSDRNLDKRFSAFEIGGDEEGDLVPAT